MARVDTFNICFDFWIPLEASATSTEAFDEIGIVPLTKTQKLRHRKQVLKNHKSLTTLCHLLISTSMSESLIKIDRQDQLFNTFSMPTPYGLKQMLPPFENKTPASSIPSTFSQTKVFYTTNRPSSKSENALEYEYVTALTRS